MSMSISILVAALFFYGATGHDIAHDSTSMNLMMFALMMAAFIWDINMLSLLGRRKQ